MQINILKIALTVLLIMLTGGAWFALDYMNRQEQMQAKAIQSGLQLAKMEARNRSRMQSSIDSLINGAETSCEAAADKAQSDYVALLQKLMPVKRKIQLPVPQPVLDEAAALTVNAKAECKRQMEEMQKKGL